MVNWRRRRRDPPSATFLPGGTNRGQAEPHPLVSNGGQASAQLPRRFAGRCSADQTLLRLRPSVAAKRRQSESHPLVHYRAMSAAQFAGDRAVRPGVGSHLWHSRASVLTFYTPQGTGGRNLRQLRRKIEASGLYPGDLARRMPPAGICAGGAGQLASLLRQVGTGD